MRSLWAPIKNNQIPMEQNNTARDVFMYLLVVIVLGMSAVNLGTLLFQYVNIYAPDTALQQCYYSSCTGAIRWSLASLIVVFPILIWVWRFLQRDIANNPEKAQSRVRRWLLYLTLFVAGVTIIGDTVSLLYSWLQGDLTIQFLLKILIVLYIAATMFYYFFRALYPKEGSVARIVAWIAVGVVAMSVIVGFVTSGSPFRARLERLDAQRVNDLGAIQYQIVFNHWQLKGVLPTTLTDLDDPINGFVVPVDPETKQPYEYRKTSDQAFTLCATFSTENIETYPAPAYPDDIKGGNGWAHASGRVCFERTIDPELYPLSKTMPLR